MNDPLDDFVRRGMAAQQAANKAVAGADDLWITDDSFPYWRIWQENKHLLGVTYEHVLQKVAFFERANGEEVVTWVTHGGNANLTHLVAVAYMKEMARRARVIAAMVTPEEQDAKKR